MFAFFIISLLTVVKDHAHACSVELCDYELTKLFTVGINFVYMWHSRFKSKDKQKTQLLR